MRVVSSLADIEFSIGGMTRRGPNLVITSSASSTLETTVTVTPRDALVSLAVVITSPSAWLFLLKLPFSLVVGKREPGSETDDWEARRKATGLNKPW